jgi:hypothetical protein
MDSGRSSASGFPARRLGSPPFVGLLGKLRLRSLLCTDRPVEDNGPPGGPATPDNGRAMPGCDEGRTMVGCDEECAITLRPGEALAPRIGEDPLPSLAIAGGSRADDVPGRVDGVPGRCGDAANGTSGLSVVGCLGSGHHRSRSCIDGSLGSSSRAKTSFVCLVAAVIRARSCFLASFFRMSASAADCPSAAGSWAAVLARSNDPLMIRPTNGKTPQGGVGCRKSRGRNGTNRVDRVAQMMAHAICGMADCALISEVSKSRTPVQ